MAWRDTMAQVLQGVMQPPQIPTNFQTPQSGIPLPPLGRFGTEALNLAGLPTSIPRRMVTPAQIIQSLPPGTQIPSDGMNDRAAPYSPPGLGGGTVDDILNGGMIPPTTEMGVPIVAGNPSRIEPPPVETPPPPEAPVDYSDSAQIPPFVYVPDPPYTYETPPPPPNPPEAVAVPPPHVPAPYVAEAVPTSEGVQYVAPPYVPEPEPVAPWAPYVPGATTTENSTILQPGTTVGDLMGGGSSFEPTFVGTVADPIGTAAQWFDNLFDSNQDVWNTPLQLVDPYDPSWGGSYYDPFSLDYLDPAQLDYLRSIGYLRDA